ncbi:hypothetical protein WJX74_007222 [Apatococcus lobatus]|uniref:Uncharacterized protein n=1 Tax=Apatococcus lobatus TaxID=904363 RepID=A0AAW1RPQ8_9CHLO
MKRPYGTISATRRPTPAEQLLAAYPMTPQDEDPDTAKVSTAFVDLSLLQEVHLVKKRKHDAEAQADPDNGAAPAICWSYSKMEMLGCLRHMQTEMSHYERELAALVGETAMRASTWQELMSRCDASVLQRLARSFLHPWTGPLSFPQRAVAVQIRRARTWKLPALPLKPISFHSVAGSTIPDIIEGRLAGDFTKKCQVCPSAQHAITARRLFAEEMDPGAGFVELEGKPSHPALDILPLELWDIVAAHVVDPVSTKGLEYVPTAARALARLSCTCAPLYEAAAAAWACLGSHLAPVLRTAVLTSAGSQSSWDEVLIGRFLCTELKPFCYEMPITSICERTGYGAKKALNEEWTRDKLIERRVCFRTRGHLCMRCMQYATEGCINHACPSCCAQAPNRCFAHSRSGR